MGPKPWARRTLRCASTAVLLATIGPLASARASDLSEDLAARRARIMARLGPDSMLVLQSAPARTYSNGIDYEYRADSNLYYLTGLTEQGATLVLMPGNTSHREILFIKPRNPDEERWTGPLLSRDEAAAATGISTVMTADRFEPFIEAILTRHPSDAVTTSDSAAFFGALEAGRARLAFALDQATLGNPPGPGQTLANQLRERFVGFQVTDAAPLLADQRTVKTTYEQRLLVESARISVEAHKAGMHATKPGVHEYEVKAVVEAAERTRGASWAYPSIVGSGPNATILHYPGGDRQMQRGDLLVVDAGATYRYMSTDVTRTFPVNGTFTPEQKSIYSIVLRAQEAGIAVARAGARLTDIHNKTVEVIKQGLLSLGLITDATDNQYLMWYPHGASHFLGIDVHDVGDQQHPLEPGVAFTIEPGIYVSQAVLDQLPRTPQNNALIERIEAAVRKYDGIGVRIEDSFLLQADGLRNLSAELPRTIEQIETFMRNKTTP